MKKVLVTMQIPESNLDELKKHFEVDYNDSLNFMTDQEVISRIRGVKGMIVPLSHRIGENIIREADELEIIANFGAGYDNIDIEAASRKNIIVSNSPAKGSTNSTAELSMGLIIDIMRGISSGERLLRQGEFKGWKPTFGLGPTLESKTLGIFGMGRIGQALAKRARAFEMKLIYNSRTRLDKDLEEELGLEYVDFDELISRSDVLSLHTSYSDELHHKFSMEVFEKMKKDAYLVNASRGKVIKEADLAQALRKGIIKGAALDVYEFEPDITDRLLDLPNILLVPHLGNATLEAREEMGRMAVENIIAVLNGREAPNRVN